MSARITVVNVHGLTSDEVEVVNATGTIWLDLGSSNAKVGIFPEGITAEERLDQLAAIADAIHRGVAQVRADTEGRREA